MEQIVDLSRTTVAVVAHCDDLELGAGGTVARLCDDGWVVHVLILCSQQMTPERTADEVAQMAALRERESMVGARVLGITSENLHFFRLANFSDTRNTVGKIHQKCEQLFGSKKPALPFVLTHTVNDQHPDHRKSFEIASAAFRVPLLCMLVASSTANRFNPIIGVDISTTFERKLAAFKAHESQQTLQAGLGGLMVERLRDIDAQEQRRVGFKYGEFFELVYLYADRENVASFIPVARLCDSRPHFEKLIDQLGGDDQYLKVNARQVLEREAPALHNGRTGSTPGAICAADSDQMRVCAPLFDRDGSQLDWRTPQLTDAQRSWHRHRKNRVMRVYLNKTFDVPLRTPSGTQRSRPLDLVK